MPVYTESGKAVPLYDSSYDLGSIISSNSVFKTSNLAGNIILEIERNGYPMAEDVFTSATAVLTEGKIYSKATGSSTKTIWTVIQNRSGVLKLAIGSNVTATDLITELKTITYSNSSSSPKLNKLDINGIPKEEQLANYLHTSGDVINFDLYLYPAPTDLKTTLVVDPAVVKYPDYKISTSPLTLLAVDNAPTWTSVSSISAEKTQSPYSVNGYYAVTTDTILNASSFTDPDFTDQYSQFALHHIKAIKVSSIKNGVLKIGLSAETATEFSSQNNIIDQYHSAYWLPAYSASGQIDAFTATMIDDFGLSSTNTQTINFKVSNFSVSGKFLIDTNPNEDSYFPGSILSVNTSNLSDQDGMTATTSFKFQWYRDGSLIENTTDSGVSSSSYTLTAHDIGHEIYAIFSYKDNAGFNEAITSNHLIINSAPSPNTEYTIIKGKITGNKFASNVFEASLYSSKLSIIGGIYDDSYLIEYPSQSITESTNGGNDTVYFDAANVSTYTLPKQVENLIFLPLNGDNLSMTGIGNNLNNVISGNDSTGKLYGGAGNDTLTGGTGKQMLYGETGDDTLVANYYTSACTLSGGLGNDVLIGSNASQDIFLFDYKYTSKNPGSDKIFNFDITQDKIAFSYSAYNMLGQALTPSQFYFKSGPSGSPKLPICYDSTTGKLSFDPDGTAQTLILLGVLDGNPKLTPDNFMVL